MTSNMSYKINYTAEEKIKLAKDDSVEKLYESKKNQRTVRVLTVLAYVLTVSMAAIILSTYYVFFWNPKHINLIQAQSKANCEKIIIPEHIAVRLINNTVISLDTFYNNTMMHLHQIHSNAIKNHARMRDRVEFNRYLETMTYEEVATTMSMDANKKMRRKMKQSKKIVDDEDLNVDMESSGDKDQLLVTTFPPPTSEPSTDMNDTTIIFDQDSDD